MSDRTHLALNAITTVCFCVAILFSVLQIRLLRKRAETAEKAAEQASERLAEVTRTVEGQGDRE